MSDKHIPSQKAISFLNAIQESVYSQDDFARSILQSVQAQFTPEGMERYEMSAKETMSTEELSDDLASLRNLIADGNALLPTRYEDIGTYSLMVDLMADIEEAVSHYSIPLLKRPVLGTLPNGRVNAMAIAVPSSDEFIIIFEKQLFIFANLVSKAIAQVIPFQGTNDNRLTFSLNLDDVINHVETDPMATRPFIDVVISYLFFGMPGAARQYFPPPHIRHLSEIIRLSMELFLMGHEYGHIVCGHFSSSKKVASALGAEWVDEIWPSWEQEFEADARGIQFMLHAMRPYGYNLAMSFWGADLFFSLIEIIEQSVAILKTGDENNRKLGSHPPGILRRESLHKLLINSLSAEEAKAPIHLSKQNEQILQFLWNRMKPSLHELYKDGKRPAPTW